MLLRDALRPGTDERTTWNVVDAVAAEGAKDFVPDLYRLLESSPRFITRDGAARALALFMSAEQGMYFVVPLVVPEESAKYGMVPGHVQSISRGNPARQ